MLLSHQYSATLCMGHWQHYIQWLKPSIKLESSTTGDSYLYVCSHDKATYSRSHLFSSKIVFHSICRQTLAVMTFEWQMSLVQVMTSGCKDLLHGDKCNRHNQHILYLSEVFMGASKAGHLHMCRPYAACLNLLSLSWALCALKQLLCSSDAKPHFVMSS